MVLGGKGANQAVAAARAGARTSFVGCVGDDLFRPLVVDGLGAEGIDLAHLRTVAGPTGIAHIRVDASAQNDIVVVPQANSSLDAQQIDDALTALAPTASVLLTQLETPRALTAGIVARGRALGFTVILDPAPAAALPDEVWADVDIVTPNETEARTLTGITVTDAASAALAGEWFVQRGAGAAVITLAEHGACVVAADGTRLVPPFPVDAVDTTAAGDAFAGFLGAALAAGSALTDAVGLASAAGALAHPHPRRGGRAARGRVYAVAMTTLILTVAGADRPGLVAAVADVVDAHGGNWENSSLAELAGTFAGVIEVSVAADRAADLEGALRGLDGLLTIAVRTGADAAASTDRLVSLQVLGNDRPGIVREVSTVLSAHALSIDELATETRDAAMAGGRLFEASVTAKAPASVDLEALRGDLERLATEIQVDITLD
ncbi:hypothetical protein HA402_008554 [Bradysia odoriphaga]|nr:hypothetical protein HA402_008554 [Bradysia odoriphaga]